MNLSESPRWVQEQVRAGLKIKEKVDIKGAIDSLATEALISFFEEHKDSSFSKNEKTTENSAAHVTAYQKALTVLGIKVDIDGIWGQRTKAALQEFQKINNVKPIDGIPGPKTAGKIIEKLKEKVVNPTTESPEILEKTKVSEIIQNAKKNSMISRMNSAGSFYSGSSPTLIDYAIVRQPDGENYLFDKPENGTRMVYRTDKNYEVISSAQVKETGEIIKIKGTLVNIPYMPTPIAQ